MNSLSPGPAGISPKPSTCLKVIPSVVYVILYLSLFFLVLWISEHLRRTSISLHLLILCLYLVWPRHQLEPLHHPPIPHHPFRI